MRWFNIIVCWDEIAVVTIADSAPPLPLLTSTSSSLLLIVSSLDFKEEAKNLCKREREKSKTKQWWNETGGGNTEKELNVCVKWPTAKSFDARIIYTLVNMYKHINLIFCFHNRRWNELRARGGGRGWESMASLWKMVALSMFVVLLLYNFFFSSVFIYVFVYIFLLSRSLAIR